MLTKVRSAMVSLACVWAAFGMFAGSVPVSAGEAPVEALTPVPVSNSHVVCLDPGHQSYEVDMSAQEPNGPGSGVMKAKASSGTQGTYTGIPEYALNLDVSLMLRDILENRGYTVIMTRTDNETAISNMERAVMAGNEGAEIFVRIHANGEESHQKSGALALCPSASNPFAAQLSAESEKLSSCILNAYCQATGFGNLGVQFSDTMTGINWSTVPVTILEMGFMTNESDDTRMANVEFRQIMAEGIAAGIDSYFGIDTSAVIAASSEKPREEAAQETAQSAASSEKPREDGTELPGKADSGTASAEESPEPRPDAAMRLLLPQIQEKLPAGNGEWAVYVGDLSSGAAAAMNSKQMQAASLIKLYIMGAVYEKYEEITGSHGKEQVDGLLHAMITVSDNDAANTLTEYLGNGDPDAGMKAVTEYCTSHGYKDSHMGRLLLHSNEVDDNYTSVRDCGLFLTRIYTSCKEADPKEATGKKTDKKADKDTSKKSMPGAADMFSLLSQQTRTNKIPSQLPAGVRAANKTGELADVENDAGIIYETAGGKDLVVCFMSERLSSPGEAQTAIGELSHLIYSYYNEPQNNSGSGNSKTEGK